ncbi:hypothetical protein HMPREF1181_01914 [Bacteroides stercoris CC31F]|uniref:Uncharacterized protein n=1 Tax=Bacteroides stercoris CC31F TaxID=1073351 RepID=S3YRI6_BACSE|nr:hypothetical protein HMPREF1181_01914 [Bacteroides stercoris CC31F]
MNLETKITIYKFTPQVFTLTHFYGSKVHRELCRIRDEQKLSEKYT